MAKKKEEDKQPDEQVVKKKPNNTMKMVLMIGIPIMIFQGGLAYFLISQFAQPANAISETGVEVGSIDVDKPGFLYTFEDVIVNPAGTAGSRFLNATIVLEFTKADLQSEITEKEIQIRDALINVFVGKTIPEMDGPEEQDMLKEEIITVINTKILKQGKLRRVYFPSFIFQ